MLIKPGDKVGASEATLLNMLNISPFSFGLLIQQVYDNGSVYSPEVLDITEDALHARFLEVRKRVHTTLPCKDTFRPSIYYY
jgi:large subunit ribosomal protein LP0